MAERYQQAFVREVTGRDGKPRWKGVLKYQTKNRDYVPKPEEGEDTRKPSEKRKVVWRQKASVLRTYKDRNGNVREVRTENQANRALQQWREQMEREAAMGQGASKVVTQYIDEYIDLREKVPIDGKRILEPSTALDYRKTRKLLEPAFADITVGEVTSRFVKQWETEQMKAGRSAHSIRKCHRLLHLVFEHAFIEEDIESNPMRRVPTPDVGPKSEADSLTRDDMWELSEKLKAMEPTAVVVAAYLGLHAGLRCGEACALRWRDVDFDEGLLTVRKSIGFRKGGTYEKDRTKNGSTRLVPFDTEEMGKLLMARRNLVLASTSVVPASFRDCFVLGTLDGRFPSPTTISRNWATLAKELQLASASGASVNYHMLRHSYCTAQLAASGNLRDTASNAGHLSPTMTADTYASALLEGKREAARKMGEYMRGGKSTRGKVTEHDFEKTGTGD